MTGKKRSWVYFSLAAICSGFLGGCVYTSKVVFPSDQHALYCFYDDEAEISYLYRITSSKREVDLITKFDHPVFALALSKDRETLFYYELFEDMEPEKGKETGDFLALNMLKIRDLPDTGKAKFICHFKVDEDAGIGFGSTFGAATILPVMEKGMAFVNYVQKEDHVVLSTVDLKTGREIVMEKGIAVYPKLSPDGKYLAYIRAEKEKDDEKDAWRSVVVVLDVENLKEVEKKDLGIWEIPPEFDFVPAKGKEYEIFYPVGKSNSKSVVPRGVSMKMHYLDTLACIAGSRHLLLYDPKDTRVEITGLTGGIQKTFDRKDFIPLAWSPGDRSFFLGRDEYLAEYIMVKKIFVIYRFAPPEDEGKGPEVYLTLEKEIPGERDSD